MSDKTKTKVLTEKDIMNVTGGTDNEGKRVSGMPCPVCHGWIPISMYQIMSSSSIFCPCCGMKLDINKQASSKALEILRQLQEQQS